MTVFYASPPLLIGRTYRFEWRVIVTELSWKPGTRVTEYQGRPPGLSYWRSSREWPTYDFNHTCYGLPRGLIKLWERYQPEIECALGKEPAQLSLSLTPQECPPGTSALSQEL